MRKRRSAKLPSKYVGNMPLEHASRRSGTHLLGRYVEKYRKAAEKEGEGEMRERKEGKGDKGSITCGFLQISLVCEITMVFNYFKYFIEMKDRKAT